MKSLEKTWKTSSSLCASTQAESHTLKIKSCCFWWIFYLWFNQAQAEMSLIVFKKHSLLFDADIQKTSGALLFPVYAGVFILQFLINAASHSPPLPRRSGYSHLFALPIFTFSAASLSCWLFTIYSINPSTHPSKKRKTLYLVFTQKTWAVLGSGSMCP